MQLVQEIFHPVRRCFEIDRRKQNNRSQDNDCMSRKPLHIPNIILCSLFIRYNFSFQPFHQIVRLHVGPVLGLVKEWVLFRQDFWKCLKCKACRILSKCCCHITNLLDFSQLLGNQNCFLLPCTFSQTWNLLWQEGHYNKHKDLN